MESTPRAVRKSSMCTCICPTMWHSPGIAPQQCPNIHKATRQQPHWQTAQKKRDAAAPLTRQHLLTRGCKAPLICCTSSTTEHHPQSHCCCCCCCSKCRGFCHSICERPSSNFTSGVILTVPNPSSVIQPPTLPIAHFGVALQPPATTLLSILTGCSPVLVQKDSQKLFVDWLKISTKSLQPMGMSFTDRFSATLDARDSDDAAIKHRRNQPTIHPTNQWANHSTNEPPTHHAASHCCLRSFDPAEAPGPPCLHTLPIAKGEEHHRLL